MSRRTDRQSANQGHRVLPLFATIAAVVCAATPEAVGQKFVPRMRVQQETRLDWTFAVSNRSLSEAPAEWLPDYKSTDQRYALFLPRRQKDAALPLVVFVPAGPTPVAWELWKKFFAERGIAYAEPYKAGNQCPGIRRSRIVLDVLDDVRRRANIDPDRTYIAGYSGGGRVACAIGFALPECFGGVMPFCAGGDLRNESWLRQRVRDRLSVALVTGETDFNRSEVERLRAPILENLKIRSRTWTVRRLGHALPATRTFRQAFDWLEEAVPARRALAKDYPASRVGNPSREEWSAMALAEAKKRIESDELRFIGLMQFKGISNRWLDTPAGKEARELVQRWHSDSDQWAKQDIDQQRQFLQIRARAATQYATGPIPPGRVMFRSDYAQKAINTWMALKTTGGGDTKIVAEADTAIMKLEKLLKKK